MNKRFRTGFMALTLSMALLSGCGAKEEAVATEATTAVQVTEASTAAEATTAEVTTAAASTEAVTEDPGHPGMEKNDLTGEWIDAAINRQRPVSVMINNIDVSMPQSGIEKADIIMECLVEGGITRLMAIYSDYSGLEKIGSVRSARHYYDRKSIEFDAIYVHYGQSHFAEDDFKTYSGILDDINGLYDSGFYRDDSREAPHNAYIDSEGIANNIKNQGIRAEKKEDYTPMLHFFDEYTVLNGNPAEKVVTAFNGGRKPWFEYDADEKLYYRFQYGDEQIDDQTDNQLAFTNILIQFCDHTPIEGETYIDIEWVGSGDGYLISGGEVVPITWKKTSDLSITQYFAADGSELKLNPGKTWITVFPDDEKDGIQFETLKKTEE